MNPFHALALGILQGLTEILPISSSAHLILVPWLFGWPESGLTFDVALHLGTLVALVLYFRHDVAELVANAVSGLARGLGEQSTRLPYYIVAATVPAAIVGKAFEAPIEEFFRSSITLIAVLMVAFGLVLAFADTTGSKRWRMDRMDLKAAMIIGVAQCLALIPGVSRSGVTIVAALFLGFNRETAARFSFLLSLPVVAGAATLKLGHLVTHGIPAGELTPLLIGIASSAIVGYFSIALLLRLVQRRSLYPFVWYRLIVGAAILTYVSFI